MSKKCKHDKVYDERTLLSNPPQYRWICSKCGYCGKDIGWDDPRPSYDDLFRKFHES